MEEIWKEIEGFEGLYSVSNYGRIKSIPHIIKYKGDSEYHVKGKMMKPHLANGYYQAILTVNGKRYHIGVHRLVAKAFIPNPDNKPEVNHIDGDKTNNSIQNLEWVTSSENCRHAFKIGLRETSYGNRKLSDEDVRYIKSEYENRKSRFWGKKKIAEKLGISLSAIDFIITGVTWGGV